MNTRKRVLYMFASTFLYCSYELLTTIESKMTSETCNSDDPQKQESCLLFIAQHDNRSDIMHFEHNEPPRAQRVVRQGVRWPHWLWPRGIVYYALEPEIFDFTDCEVRLIKDAMQRIEDYTCIRFVNWTELKVKPRFARYLSITDGQFPGQCQSRLGYIHLKPTLRLGKLCFGTVGIIEHELHHVLGVHHQQNRPDRDEYIELFLDNVPDYAKSKFDVSYDTTSQGLVYDYNSLMQYDKWAYALNYSKAVMRSRKYPNACLGQGVKSTACDLERLRILYNCTLRDAESCTNTEPKFPLGYPPCCAYLHSYETYYLTFEEIESQYPGGVPKIDCDDSSQCQDYQDQ